MNIYKKIGTISLCLIVVGLGLAAIGNLTGGKTFLVKSKTGYSVIDDYKTIKETKNLEEFNNIKIDANYLDNVYIVKGKEYKIEINYSERMGNINYKVEDKNLVISQENDNTGTIGFNIGLINKDEDDFIKIYVPENKEMKDIDIKSDSSDIVVKEVAGDNISILCNYGDINLNNITSNDMYVKANSGDIQMKDIKGNLIEVTNSYGDSIFESIKSKDLIANIKSGDAELSNIEILEKFEVDNSYGDVDIVDSNINKMKASISSGDISVNNSNIIDSNIDNSYGDVKYSTNESENLYNYSLICSYGDVSVNGKEFGDSLDKNNDGERNITINSQSGDIKLNFR